MIRTIVAVFFALALAACGNSSPGPLAGTWQPIGVMPMKTTFRNGESETMGIIEKVDYKVDGQSVIVTNKDGMLKGTSFRFERVNPTTAHALGMTYQKIGN